MHNSTTIHGIPKQNIPFSEKTDVWAKDCIDAFVRLSKFEGGAIGYDEEVSKLYDYYNGRIHENDYGHIIKPYGKKRKNVPIKIQNYNIIKPVVDLLLGEKAKRPNRDSVTVTNPDAITIKEQKKKKALQDNLKKHMLRELQGIIQIPDGLNLDELPPPQHVAEFFEQSYADQRADLGQKSLTFIKKYCDIYRKFRKMWKHFIISGEMYSIRDVVGNEPYYEILNPMDVDYDKDPDLDFVEDGDWAIIRRFKYPSTVVDEYHKHLTNAEIARLENPQGSARSGLVHSTDSDDRFTLDDRLIEVLQVYWTSRKKIGFLTYVDGFGQLQETIVEEDYQPEENEEVDWVWINEIWEGHCIDSDIYVKMQPYRNQRRSKDNLSRCKLPVNGRKYSEMNSRNISIVKIAAPYQILYNAYRYRLELAIAKSKDIVAVMDKNAIPKDMDMDKFMHFVDTMGIMWVDYSQEGIHLNPQQQSVLDLSIKTINSYIELLQSIRMELEELTGINRQRKGQVSAYEGKSVSQQAIVQSATITEDLFTKMAEMEERDLQGILDVSQIAWIDGKKTTFNMPDGTVEYLNIEGPEYANAEFGVFVSNSRKDAQKLDALKELSQAMLQNGTSPATIVEALDSENFTQIKNKIKKAEKQQQELMQAQQKAEQNMQAQEVALEQEKIAREDERNIRDNHTKLEVALINAEGTKYSQDTKKEIEDQKIRKDERLKQEELREEERHNKASEAINRMEARIKKQTNGTSK